MNDLLKIISDYGVSTLVVILFVYDWIVNKKEVKNTLSVIKETSTNMNNILEELKSGNENIASSLAIISKSVDNQKDIINEIKREVTK